MRRVFLVVLALLLPPAAWGCFWIHGTTLDGESKNYEGHEGTIKIIELQAALDDSPEEKLQALIAALFPRGSPPADDQEIAAMKDVVQGRYPQAIERFTAIEEAHPGAYAAAVNLGTAYELNGQNDLALHWIREGIKRNPESHYGTEWLHALILETKLKLAQDPPWLETHHVLDFEESQLATPDFRFEAGGRKLTAGELAKAIAYQLHERMLFVKPPDPIIADLLRSLAAIEAHIGLVEEAIPLLHLAREYGSATPALIEDDLSRYWKPTLLRRLKLYGGLAVCLAAASLPFWYFRRHWLFLEPGGGLAASQTATPKTKWARRVVQAGGLSSLTYTGALVLFFLATQVPMLYLMAIIPIAILAMASPAGMVIALWALGVLLSRKLTWRAKLPLGILLAAGVTIPATVIISALSGTIAW